MPPPAATQAAAQVVNCTSRTAHRPTGD